MDVEKVLALLRAMNAEGVRYVVLGVLALAVHGFVRATEYVEISIEPSADNAECLKRALRTIWNDPAIDEIGGHELCGEYPAMAYYAPGETFGINVFCGSEYASLATEAGTLGDVIIRVVTPAQLFQMKRDTMRHHDSYDAAVLQEKFRFDGDSNACL